MGMTMKVRSVSFEVSMRRLGCALLAWSFLFVVGRADEIDDVVKAQLAAQKIPGAAVVVLKDERKGQISAEDIIEWSRHHMAAYKVPRLVDFTDALPRSGTGKIQWRTLQEREWEGVTRS